jgi:hypothetical protein
MATLLWRFSTPITGVDGVKYLAQACGCPTVWGTWHGWIEFIPVGSGVAGRARPIRTPRETTQPNRVDTEYWASGLTPVYLEGALERALHALTI